MPNPTAQDEGLKQQTQILTVVPTRRPRGRVQQGWLVLRPVSLVAGGRALTAPHVVTLCARTPSPCLLSLRVLIRSSLKGTSHLGLDLILMASFQPKNH